MCEVDDEIKFNIFSVTKADFYFSRFSGLSRLNPDEGERLGGEKKLAAADRNLICLQAKITNMRTWDLTTGEKKFKTLFLS